MYFIKGIPLTKKEEIEKKRQEALAKLESKKKQGSFTECKYIIFYSRNFVISLCLIVLEYLLIIFFKTGIHI